jgi:hypothetical protein
LPRRIAPRYAIVNGRYSENRNRFNRRSEVDENGMNYPTASYAVSKDQEANDSESRHPRCFVGVSEPDWPRFPLKTCGHDVFRIGAYLTQQAAANEPSAIQSFRFPE